MKQLLILSGKGGTGKTTIASAFIKLHNAKTSADCDVDAPNLHLIMDLETEADKSDYYGLQIADINMGICTCCDICRQACRFDAISVSEDESYKVNIFACEGCGVCEYVCPVDAITMVDDIAGELMLYKEERRVFSTAQLKMGRGTSGLLVTEVKKQMKDSTSEISNDVELAIIDGSPGIGCPVIASITGVDMVLVVAEPSVSGISDMERVLETATKLGVKTAVCTNKFDTNINKTKEIEKFCNDKSLAYLGRIPFDSEAVRAVNNGLSIVDVDCISGRAVKSVYEKTLELLLEKGNSANDY